jgi:hypothetical protein
VPDALTDKALDFYNNSIDGMYATQVPFEDVIIVIAMQFISHGAVIHAMMKFEQVAYNPELGIIQYMTELDNLANHMICIPDEYTILKRVVSTLPDDMREHLIKICHLSPIISPILEWVQQIEILEKLWAKVAAFRSAPTFSCLGAARVPL